MTHNFDRAAETIMDELFDGSLGFHETQIECAKCGELLDVYYCENRVYAVRCANCETVALVKADSPKKAALRVGVPGEDRKKGQTMRCPINGAPCNECRPGSPCAKIIKEG